MRAVEFDSVRFGYADKPLFDRFSLGIEAGEFFGIIGPNGAGKSTLLKLAAGLLKPEQGAVRVMGKDLAVLRRTEVARLLGVVLQENPFAFDYPVEDVVMMGRNPYLGRFEQPGAKDRAVCTEAMRAVDALELRHSGINAVSTGEKQRVVLARALAQEPAILLLDEATSHLDIAHQQMIARILVEQNRQGRTIVLLSHDLNLAALYCSRLLLLSRGTAVACDAPERVVTRELIRTVYGLDPILTRHPETGRPQVMLPSAGAGRP